MAKENTQLVRKNIRMGTKVADWYEKKSNETGISQSSLMVMALDTYINQQELPNMIDDLNRLIKEAKEIEKDMK